ERGTFYSDAWKLYKDYPIVGAGAGAWSTLYEQYQNNPYTSRLAHSFIMQHLVETGILGVIILLAFIIIVLFQFITRLTAWRGTDQDDSDPRLPYFLFALPVLVHSMIDFDMSFVYLAAVLFLCLGAMTVGSRPVFNITKPTFLTRWNRIYPVTLAVLSLIMLIGAFQILRANNLHNKIISSAHNATSYQSLIDSFDQILKIRDANPYYTESKAQLLTQLYAQTNDELYYTENLDLLNDTLQSEPYNSGLLNRKLDLLLSKNKFDQAFPLTNQALVDFPWNVTLYEKNMVLAIILAENRINVPDWTQARPYIDTALATYQQLNRQIEHLTTLPEGQLQGNSFLTTPTIELVAAKAYYYTNEFEAAGAILKPLVDAQQPKIRYNVKSLVGTLHPF
ncbi:MAG: O-antigen ligase family protein, partial [Paenibacillaceae bacterium]